MNDPDKLHMYRPTLETASIPGPLLVPGRRNGKYKLRCTS